MAARPEAVDGQDTRTRLLLAAVAVIEAKGEGAVRVRDVSAAAGVSYASLYHFFKDRDGLIDAAQAERFHQSLRWLVPDFADSVKACRSKREFRALVTATMQRIFQPDRIPSRWTRASVLGSAASRPDLARQIREATETFEATLAGAFLPAQRKGWVRKSLDLPTFACWWHGVINGRLLLELEGREGDAAAWDRITIESVLAVLMGETPR